MIRMIGMELREWEVHKGVEGFAIIDHEEMSSSHSKKTALEPFLKSRQAAHGHQHVAGHIASRPAGSYICHRFCSDMEGNRLLMETLPFPNIYPFNQYLRTRRSDRLPTHESTNYLVPMSRVRTMYSGP